jgi:hypothetical protein
VPPQLKLAEDSAFLDPTADAASRIVGDGADDGRELDEIERRFDRKEEEEPAPSAGRVTPEEIKMLMSDVHPANAPSPRQDRGSDVTNRTAARDTRAEGGAEGRSDNGTGTERGSER